MIFFLIVKFKTKIEKTKVSCFSSPFVLWGIEKRRKKYTCQKMENEEYGV